RAAVGPTQPQQVIVHVAVVRQAVEQRHTRLRIDEPLEFERPDVTRRRFAGVAEDQFEVRVGGQRRGLVRSKRTDEDAFLERFKQALQRQVSGFGIRDSGFVVAHCPDVGAGGCGVGVWLGKLLLHLRSFAARMSRTEATEACICIASRATSRHTAQVLPWCSHSTTSFLASRIVTPRTTSSSGNRTTTSFLASRRMTKQSSL